MTRLARCWVMVLLLALGLEGCGGPQAAAPGSPIRLEFWTISLKPKFTPFIADMIHRYEAARPGIVIEWSDLPIGVVTQKFMASIAGGVAPDVVNLNSEFAGILAQQNALVAMDQAVPADRRAAFLPGLRDSVPWDGHAYAIPWYVTVRVLMYNSDLFRRAGLDPDHPPATWDDVAAAARHITTRTGVPGWMPAIKFLDDLQMAGVPIVTAGANGTMVAAFDTPAAVALLTWYVSLYREGVIPQETINISQAYAMATDRYQQGTLGMLDVGVPFLDRVRTNAADVYAQTRVAPLPTRQAGIVPAAVMNLVVPKASRHQAEAVDFALFVTNDGNQLAFCKIAVCLPSTSRAADDPFFTRGGLADPLANQALRIARRELDIARDLSLGLPGIQARGQALMAALQSALSGTAAPDQALAGCAAAWNRILASPEAYR